MENHSTKIKFKKSASTFYTELKYEVRHLLNEKIIHKAKSRIVSKFIMYSILYLALYISIYSQLMGSHFYLLILSYVFLGFTGILLAFNGAHDCVHKTFSKSNRINKLVFYLIFSLQGVNSRLWQKRHIASHHIFPNVDGCDADIDNNPFIRLSQQQPKRWYQKYQHVYAVILYAIYTLHWIFVKDVLYLKKKNLANLKNQTYSWEFVLEFILLKLAYFSFMILLPVLFSSASWKEISCAFLMMHCITSVFFVMTLIISHLCLETEFPQLDQNGELPHDYYEHQLAVSLDYHPESKIAGMLFGGFNAHTAHHLFPNLPHTLYSKITPFIRRLAQKHNLPYHEKTIPAAIKSHFSYLRKLGRH
jgi:linoleoyl-CoA desaturase